MPPLSASDITARYKQALGLQSKGQNGPALSLYGQILEANPKIAEVHFQVGRIFFAGNVFGKSVLHFGLAVRLKPNEPAIWNAYIPSLLCNADPDEIKRASKALKNSAIDKRTVIALQNRLQSTANGSVVPVGNLNRSALGKVQSAIMANEHSRANALASALFTKDPKSAVLAELLARTFLNLNNIGQARRFFKIANELDPMFFNAFNNHGHAELEERNFPAAIKLFKSAVIAAPRSLAGICNLADALAQNAQTEEAHALINNARKLRFKGGKLDLLQGEICVRAGQYDEAEKHYEAAIKREKPSAGLYFEIGDVFNASGQLQTAMRYYDLALELDPSNADVLFHQAVALREQGDFAAALAKIDAALSLDPDNAEYLYFYANAQKVEQDDPVIEKMIALHGNQSLGLEQRSALGFAITKSLEDTKEYDRVFPFLKSANDSVRSRFPYDVGTDIQEADELIAYFRDFKLSDYNGMGNEDAQPIFVCGMPRSGTTLVEQIVSAHSQVTGAGEVGYCNTAIVKTLRASESSVISLSKVEPKHLKNLGSDIWRYLTDHFPGNPYITDKSILTYRHMGLLKAAMPNCKFVVVQRDPRDNLLSIYRNRFKDGAHRYAYDLSDLGTYYKQFERIIDFWRDKLAGEFMEIQYEDLIDDTERHAKSLIAHSGLEWEDQCLDFHKSKRQVKTLSTMQVRQPIYKTSVKAWQRYENDLQPLFEALK
jgi:tetratricopeptide (TPR) repeat protein